MFFVRRVVGNSMLPTLRPDTLCIFRRTSRLKSGDVVLARVQNREVVKRLFRTENGWELRGDNIGASNVYAVTCGNSVRTIKGVLLWPRVK